MSNFSNYSEDAIFNHLFRGNTLAKPTTIAIALTTVPPSDASTGASMNEVPNANGYARVSLGAPSDSLFTAHGVGGPALNLSGVTFPVATSNWGWVSGVCIVDNSTHGAGNVLMHGTLSQPQFITTNGTFSFPSGSLQLSVF